MIRKMPGMSLAVPIKVISQRPGWKRFFVEMEASDLESIQKSIHSIRRRDVTPDDLRRWDWNDNHRDAKRDTRALKRLMRSPESNNNQRETTNSAEEANARRKIEHLNTHNVASSNSSNTTTSTIQPTRREQRREDQNIARHARAQARKKNDRILGWHARFTNTHNDAVIV
jgi:hypothetical protein